MKFIEIISRHLMIYKFLRFYKFWKLWQFMGHVPTEEDRLNTSSNFKWDWKKSTTFQIKYSGVEVSNGIHLLISREGTLKEKFAFLGNEI